MRAFWSLIACTYCVSMVTSYCHFRPLEDNPGKKSGFCMYEGWRLAVGSAVSSPMPMCEKCMCTKFGLNCCGYGRKGRIISVPAHCMMVSEEGSCEYSLVRKDNRNRKC